jgi:hypothetical protein
LTPEENLKCFNMGQRLAQEGHTVVSGGCLGADLEFMRGAVSEGGKVVAVLPWASYNRNLVDELDCSVIVFDKEKHANWVQLAKALHPSWPQLGNNGKKFHARNVGIVLGEGLDEVVDGIFAYPASDRRGGTEQSFRMAEFLGIPITNMRAGA